MSYYQPTYGEIEPAKRAQMLEEDYYQHITYAVETLEAAEEPLHYQSAQAHATLALAIAQGLPLWGDQ